MTVTSERKEAKFFLVHHGIDRTGEFKRIVAGSTEPNIDLAREAMRQYGCNPDRYGHVIYPAEAIDIDNANFATFYSCYSCVREIEQVKISYSAETEEYTCKVYDQHGKRWEECDYFTEDKDDAQATMLAMLGKCECADCGELFVLDNGSHIATEKGLLCEECE